MSVDCFPLRAKRKRAEEMTNDLQEKSPNVRYAQRVERHVAAVFGIQVEDFWSRRNLRKFVWPRHALWHILHQPHGFRSTTWLGMRYDRDHTTIVGCHEKVERNRELAVKVEEVLDRLVAELETELYGSPLKPTKEASDGHAVSSEPRERV